MYDVEDDESLDDPISLMYVGSEDAMQKSCPIYEVEDDVEDDLISLIENTNEKYIDADIVDLRSSDEENEEQYPMPKSGYGNKNFVIPVTFLDFYRNVKLLKKCKHLSIKVVDCDKHPWYYGRQASKPTVNVNCFTLGKHSNVIKQEVKEEIIDESNVIKQEIKEVRTDERNVCKQEIKEEKTDEDLVVLEKEREKTETLITSSQLKDKTQEESEIIGVDSDSLSIPTTSTSTTSIPTLNQNTVKLGKEPEVATKSKNSSQLDFKRNSGLVGLTISKKDLDLNLDKVIKKKTPKKRREENIVNDKVMQGIGVTLNNLGTSVIPVLEAKGDNIVGNLTKGSCDANPDLFSNSNVNFENIHINSFSPTRCSLKITNSKILQKVIQLKKTNSQDASKPKPKQKPKKTLDKDNSSLKLNLKRKTLTENDEFQIVNSNKESHSNSLSVKPQKDKIAVENKIHKRKSVDVSPIVPFVTVTVRNQQTFSPNASTNAEKLHHTLSHAALPTPESYHKKLKLKKSILSNDANQTIQNEPITKQNTNAANSSLNSGLNEVVVSNVQSLRSMNTLSSNMSTPEHFNFKVTKNKDSAAAKHNLNVNKNSENVIRNGNTTNNGTKVNKTSVLPTPSISYLRAYNAYALNCWNSLNELSRKTCRTTQMDKNKSYGEILQETEHTRNTIEQNQKNRPNDTVFVTNNNRNMTNYDVPDRDTATSNVINNAALAPKTAHTIQRFHDQYQLDEYMKHNQFHTQPNSNYTVNNLIASKTVYDLPGNNTVILRKPPAHMQTSTNRTTGLPIQTVVNNRPVHILKPSTFPPPNTNVACNVPNYTMPSMNMYTENQINPQYYWPVMNSRNPYYPPLSSVVQQERNSNLILVKNQGSNDSIIGSTANGELIKKINIGVPPNDSTVVSDKQKMLDTLNNAIKERNDLISKATGPTTSQTLDTLNNAIKERNDLISKVSGPTTSQGIRAKPCPLSKKAKIDPESIIEPNKGYSPPILPIPSFQKAMELVKMKQKVLDFIVNQAEKMDKIETDTNSIDKKHSHRPAQHKSKRKTSPAEHKKHDKSKKISLEEYKKRVSKDDLEANKKLKHKCKRKKVSKNFVVDNNQDLGYDSDATLKL